MSKRDDILDGSEVKGFAEELERRRLGSGANALRSAFLLRAHDLEETGADARHVKAADELAAFLRLEEEPAFWAEVFDAYSSDSGTIGRGGAALMALYASLVAPTKQPYEALREGVDISPQEWAKTSVEVPAWIVTELANMVQRYLSGEMKSLNLAAGVPNGDKGRDALLRPLDDLENYEAASIHKFLNAESGGQPSDRAARSLASASLAGKNVSEETLKRIQKRVRTILGKFGFSAD